MGLMDVFKKLANAFSGRSAKTGTAEKFANAPAASGKQRAKASDTARPAPGVGGPRGGAF